MKIIENYDLTPHNSYRIQATCKRAYFPASEADFVEIYKRRATNNQPVLLGGGYNVIFSKAEYDKDFVIVGESYSSMRLLGGCQIECQSGVSTETFSLYALEHELTGAEIFYDIPSSIGGAVVMNAGASGEEIKDILDSVRFLDLADMEIKEIQQSEIGFQYRNSIFQKEGGKVVLSAVFNLLKGDGAAIKEKMEAVKSTRWAKQPKEYPNAGSVFKRPPGFYVGAMIEELGLKGYTVGGAQISEKHGGFIINIGGATGAEILAIIHTVQSQVKERFGVDLEIEQRII